MITGIPDHEILKVEVVIVDPDLVIKNVKSNLPSHILYTQEFHFVREMDFEEGVQVNLAVH